jgi:hypothetical protein
MIFVRGSRKEHYQEVRIPVIVTGANKMLANLLKKLHILHKSGYDGDFTPTQKRYTPPALATLPMCQATSLS